MKISLLGKVLLTISIISFFSCEKQSKSSDDNIIKPDSVSVSVSSIEIEPSGATNITFTFSPWKSTWSINNISMTYKGTNTAHCRLKGYVSCGNGTFEACFVDNGADQTYSDDFTLDAVVNDTKYTSRPFAVKCSNIHGSNLPVVRITTSSKISDKETWINGTMTIEGQNEYPDIVSDTIQIRGRGNASWFYQKKPYAIKLNSKTSILGMPQQKRWCLIANYCDKTLLRNAVAYYIGQHTNLAWTPH